MEWSTESIEKVIFQSKNARFYLMCRQPNLHELAWKCDARNLHKKLVQVSCTIFLTVCHHHKTKTRPETHSSKTKTLGNVSIRDEALVQRSTQICGCCCIRVRDGVSVRIGDSVGIRIGLLEG